MNPGPPPVAGPPSGGDANPPVKKRRSLLFYGCGSLIVLLLVIVATVAITLWYLQRPIKPVVLSEPEKAVVETKLERVGVEPGAAFSGTDARRGTTPTPSPRAPSSDRPVIKVETDRTYVPGGKVLRLTERELNGLLNANTDLGQTVRFELDRDAINAYLAVPIPQDAPIMAGRIFRARGRFHVSLGDGSVPRAVLEDITVLGISLPKAWLGGIKGENLLDRVTGERNGRPMIKGIKSLRIEPGEIVLEVAD